MHIRSNMEIFKDIPGYEGLYQVSNLGNVKSVKRTVITPAGLHRKIKEKILSKALSQGYLIVIMSKDGKNYTKLIHQLSAMAFLGHIPNGKTIVVDHKNNIKKDNRIENLQLVTVRVNSTKDRTNPGVTWRESQNRWRSRIQINKKELFIGSFRSIEEANNSYEDVLAMVNNGCLYDDVMKYVRSKYRLNSKMLAA